MAVNINANPGKITELAAIIKDSYLAIDNETSTLNSRLKSFANTLDDCDECSNQDSENAKTSLLSCLHKQGSDEHLLFQRWFCRAVFALIRNRKVPSWE